jgi:molybdopterin-guanine dinucleotide biosynthesis protein A
MTGTALVSGVGSAGGVVLCGGRSRRMGRPKAWLPFGEELLLPRIVRLLSQAVRPVVVVAAPGQEVPPLPAEVLLVRDAVADRGPLQGLAAGLEALAGQVEAVYLSSCDVPFLRPAFVLRLLELLGTQDICVPHVGGYYHPLAAVYRLTVAPAVQRLLAENRLRPFFLFQMVPTRFVAENELLPADPTLLSLWNLNTPADYEAALQQLAQSRSATRGQISQRDCPGCFLLLRSALGLRPVTSDLHRRHFPPNWR